MIIKFSDKFESIFYAVLLSNLTGHFLIAKNNNLGLFADEEFIDIDNLNWRQILEGHNRRFGEIRWLDDDNYKFKDFKQQINLELQKNTTSKYNRVINLIKQALKFGLFFDGEVNPSKSQAKIKNKFKLFPKLDNQLI